MMITFCPEESGNDYWVAKEGGLEIARFFGQEAERNCKIFEWAMAEKRTQLRKAADMRSAFGGDG
jgi:hypothetical protein